MEYIKINRGNGSIKCDIFNYDSKILLDILFDAYDVVHFYVLDTDDINILKIILSKDVVCIKNKDKFSIQTTGIKYTIFLDEDGSYKMVKNSKHSSMDKNNVKDYVCGVLYESKYSDRYINKKHVFLRPINICLKMAEIEVLDL